MAETLIPTMQLRFVIGYIPAPEIGPDISKSARVLQQRFEKPSGGSVWVEVPFVENPNAKF